MSTATLKSIPTWEEVHNNFTACVNSLISSPINKNLNQVLAAARTYFNNKQLPSAMSLALAIDGAYIYDNFLHKMYDGSTPIPLNMKNFSGWVNINLGLNVPKYYEDGSSGVTNTIYIGRIDLYRICLEIATGNSNLILDDIYNTYPEGLYLQVKLFYNGSASSNILCTGIQISIYAFNKKTNNVETIKVNSDNYDKILVKGGFAGHTNSYLEQE